jgi:hypothetical protein
VRYVAVQPKFPMLGGFAALLLRNYREGTR